MTLEDSGNEVTSHFLYTRNHSTSGVWLLFLQEYFKMHYLPNPVVLSHTLHIQVCQCLLLLTVSFSPSLLNTLVAIAFFLSFFKGLTFPLRLNDAVKSYSRSTAKSVSKPLVYFVHIYVTQCIIRG